MGPPEPDCMESVLLALPDRRRADVRRLMHAVTERARRYFRQEFGLEAATVETEPGAIQTPASFLCVKGTLPGTLILQARASAARALLIHMTGRDCAPEEEALLLGETLNEVLNIVAGNITRDLAEAGLTVLIQPPFAAVWDGRQGTPLAGERLCSRCVLRTTVGDFLFAFAVLDQIEDL